MRRGAALVWMLVLSSCAFPRILLANRVGGDAYDFLKLGVGARAMGMGGAVVSLAGDGYSPYWNPAGLGDVTFRSVSFMHTVIGPGAFGQPLENVTHQYVGVAFPNVRGGTAALSAIRYGVSDLERTTLNGNQVIETGETFQDAELALGASYGGRYFRKTLSVGGGVQYLQHTLGERTGQGLGFQVGFIAHLNEMRLLPNSGRPFLGTFHDVRLGLSVRRYTDESWDDGESESDPGTSTLGLSTRLAPSDVGWLTVAADLERSEGRPLKASVGVEFTGLFLPQVGRTVSGERTRFWLRAGLHGRYLEGPTSGDAPDPITAEELNEARSWTAGGGLSLPIPGLQDLLIDVAVAEEHLGVRRRISISGKF